MDIKKLNTVPIPVSIEPWLSVNKGEAAVSFYKAAFGAIETYRMEAPDGGLVVRLSVDAAGFWLSYDANSQDTVSSGGPIRMIVTVTDPDAAFARALKAGASEVFPVSEDYGWRLGRLVDPFGHHWEIGRLLADT
jgi:PhnB protein